MTTETEQPMVGELEREPCKRCSGSGQILKTVSGQDGFTPCPNCDNIPKYALPNDPPEDPHARLEEIDEKLDELQTRKEEYQQNRSKLVEAATLIEDTSDSDHLDSDDAAVLDHISHEIKSLSHSEGVFDERSIDHSERTLKERKQLIKRYVKALEAQQEDMEVDQ